jgi:uncharacterized protein YbjQ (UPF0145 family)
VADWDGRGLPPVAAERVRRAAAGGPWTSLLSAPAAAGLEVAGFDPVGEVMGSIVSHTGWQGYRGCSLYTGPGMRYAPVTTGVGGYAPYLDALYHGYTTAMERMLVETRAIGGDGVVGVTLEVGRLDGSSREFVALGTAVRARGRVRPARPFSTDLPAPDVAKLVLAGWMPADLVFGISVGIRHDDWRTRAQGSWGAGNVEVTGHTELVTHVRADARHRFAEHVRRSGADGAVVSAMSLRTWAVEPSENHRDHVGEATLFGTALAAFPVTRPARRPLTILPLSSAPRETP